MTKMKFNTKAFKAVLFGLGGIIAMVIGSVMVVDGIRELITWLTCFMPSTWAVLLAAMLVFICLAIIVGFIAGEDKNAL
jgi:hypothetical protein